jgi:hypothetical protein
MPHVFDAIEHDGRVCLALLAKLERDAADRGCARVAVGTAHHRTEAHARRHRPAVRQAAGVVAVSRVARAAKASAAEAAPLVEQHLGGVPV